MYIMVKLYDGVYICASGKNGKEFKPGTLEDAIWFVEEEQARAAAKALHYGKDDIVLEGVEF
jgi:hypothetical protein